MKKCLIIYNPHSGNRQVKKYLPEITKILNKKDIVPSVTSGGLSTVAVRMPEHPVIAKVIKESGIYLAAPSSNLSGRPSPTKASHVIEDMSRKISAIVDGSRRVDWRVSSGERREMQRETL